VVPYFDGTSKSAIKSKEFVISLRTKTLDITDHFSVIHKGGLRDLCSGM
jgi:hypothetical protein